MDRLKALNMARPGHPAGRKVTFLLISSYAFDWIILIAMAVVGYVLGNIKPNQRPFSLENPDISFPFTERETVTTLTLMMCVAVAPIVIIAIITLIFVPGSTVPRGTPQALVWRRKLWELHAGWLGLAMALISAWFVTNGMKNLFGKPRPDLLSRCEPDIANVADYIVGGIANVSSSGQLVSADICKSTDLSKLHDGFRSYPSGHSSSSAAGLIYLSMFIASKFAITVPFLATSRDRYEANAFSAFPSRIRSRTGNVYERAGDDEGYELVERNGQNLDAPRRSDEPLTPPRAPSSPSHDKHHPSTFHGHLGELTPPFSARRAAAAPPLYLLVIAAAPTFAAIFIASSRWFDFRHHGFDILFGFLIGLITAIFAFRYYHLPITRGAGWAWGPRSHDKAFWAGVGSVSYATDRFDRGPDGERLVSGDEEQALSSAHSAADAAKVNRPQTGGGNLTSRRSESPRT